MQKFLCTFLMGVMMIFVSNLQNRLEAASITENDCAIGGVKAGWHSTHHYLPEKFNKTGLKEVNWLESKINIPLDNFIRRVMLSGLGKYRARG